MPKQHAAHNAMTEAAEITRFYDRCSDLMRELLDALAEAPGTPRTFPAIEDVLGWPHRRIASVLGGVSHLRNTEFGGRRPYRFHDEREAASGRWEMWMDATQARAVRDTRRAMSQENVATARAFVDAYNREDFDAALELGAPGLVLDFSRALGPYRGVYPRERIRSFLEELNATFESVRFEPRDFIEAGDNVVMPMTIHFQGRDGIAVKAQTTNLWAFRGGAVERIVLYQELHEALEAAGG